MTASARSVDRPRRLRSSSFDSTAITLPLAIDHLGEDSSASRWSSSGSAGVLPTARGRRQLRALGAACSRRLLADLCGLLHVVGAWVGHHGRSRRGLGSTGNGRLIE